MHYNFHIKSGGRNTTTEREDSDSTTATDDERSGPTGMSILHIIILCFARCFLNKKKND